MNSRPATDPYAAHIARLAARIGPRADDILRRALGVAHDASDLESRIADLGEARRPALWRALREEEHRHA